jgi:hydroxyacylglutathione hydrolase
MADKPYRILRIPVINVACYLIYNKHSAILVDTGHKGAGEKIIETLDHLGLSKEVLKLIVITHGHYDHAGSAREIRQQTGAPVAIHREDADRLKKGYGPLPDGTRWKAKIVVAVGRILFRRLGRIPSIDPDIILEERFDLAPFGFKGSILHMPGHTAGSVVVYLEGGDVIAGDTLFGIGQKEIFPPFADDPKLLIKSWERLLAMPINYFYPGHGRKISRSELKEEFESAKIKYGQG